MKPNNQRGVILILVLILMAVMLIGGLALMKSVGSTTLITGNIAFKEAATQAADVAFQNAENFLNALTAPDTAVTGQYLPLEQAVDASGLPTSVSWSGISTTSAGMYRYQWIIERLCSGSLPVTDPATQCRTAAGALQGSQRIGAPVYESLPPVYYRVTVRVTGPHNALSFAQGLYTK